MVIDIAKKTINYNEAQNETIIDQKLFIRKEQLKDDEFTAIIVEEYEAQRFLWKLVLTMMMIIFFSVVL